MIQIIDTVAPIFIITLIGFLFGRSKFDLHVATLSTVVIMVGLPSLIFSSLTSMDMSLERLGEVFLAAVSCMVIAAIFSLGVVKAFGFSVRTFLPSLIFPNSGNMGLPLAFLAFGDIGLRLAIAYFVVIALLQHTVGMTIASGKYDLGSLLRQPLIYSVIGVLIVIGFDLTVPNFIVSTTEILGGLMIPSMLILLGNSLASLKISDAGPAIVVAIARLVIGCAAAFGTIWFLGLSGTLAGVVFLLSTMPTAVVTYVYAERFRPDPEKIAGAVVMSTLLTFALLPGLIHIAKAISLH